MAEKYHVITKDDVRDFRISANPEAELLEQNLGIAFPVRPQKIELGLFNSWTLLRKTALRRYTGIPLHELLTASSSRSISLPRIDTIMITRRGNPEWRYFASLHENMHGSRQD